MVLCLSCSLELQAKHKHDRDKIMNVQKFRPGHCVLLGHTAILGGSAARVQRGHLDRTFPRHYVDLSWGSVLEEFVVRHGPAAVVALRCFGL